MQDHQIFHIALLCTIIGLVGMIFMSGYIMPQEIKIRDINKNYIGEDVAITGFIKSIQAYKNNVYALSVIDSTGEIKVIIFSSIVDEFKKQGEDIKDFENKRVKIVGNVKEYKGSFELIVEDTKSIKIII